MLKKLAKYGNSTALVIDKAILELLNIDDSSLVKLQTDGKSLIITPVSRIDKDKISYVPEEAAMVAIKTESEKQEEKCTATPAEREKIISAMSQDFKEAFEKHKGVMEKFSENLGSNQGFNEALALLAQKYDPVAQSEDYIKEFLKLKSQFFPELAELDKEFAALTLKYSDYIYN